MTNLSADDLKSIDAAVASVADRLQPEDRFDLRQELAIKLLKHYPTGNVRAWLRTCALNWTANFVRDEATHRQMLYELGNGLAVPGCRRGPEWSPTWYPPHRDAKEHAPFACKGARVMTCKQGQKSKRDDDS